jgi:hypothetical protein
MTEDIPEIRLLPIASITVLNPRSRNRRVFNELVASISKLGLKKPITVSRRATRPITSYVAKAAWKPLQPWAKAISRRSLSTHQGKIAT